jgi:hypothetical protein
MKTKNLPVSFNCKLNKKKWLHFEIVSFFKVLTFFFLLIVVIKIKIKIILVFIFIVSQSLVEIEIVDIISSKIIVI